MKTIVVSGFQLLVAILVPLASFTTGLQARRSETPRLWNRPAVLLRALAAILILVPLWAWALVQIMPLAPLTKAGLMIAVIAIGIGPFAAMKRMDGDTPHSMDAFDLNVVVLILSLVLVPLGFAGLAQLFGSPIHLGTAPVAKVVLGRALFPLLLGLAAARLFPSFAGSASVVLTKVITVVMLVLIALALISLRQELASLGAIGFLACAGVALGAALIGHLLGGPDPGTRRAVVASSTMRFPGLALTLASVAPAQKKLVPVVIAYVLASAVVVTVYDRLMAGRSGVLLRRREQRA